MLSLHESGAKLVQKYGNPEIPVNDKDRNEIINLALGHVVKAIGNYYPKSSTKEKLAEAIVKAFPQMGFSRTGLPSHAYIYNSATANAFLDQHLKRMRNAALSDTERKRKSSGKETIVKGKGKTLKKKSEAAAISSLDEDYVTKSKDQVCNSVLFFYYAVYSFLNC